MPERPLARVVRIHLGELDGPLGTWQHATGVAPNESFGYCTDDVARALVVDLLHRRSIGWEAVSAHAWRSCTFLRDAFDPAAAWFRNLRAADGVWLDELASEDCQGRALLALGIAARDAPEVPMRLEAAALLVAALPGARRLTSLRAVASAVLGCEAAIAAGIDGETDRTFAQLVGRLRRAFQSLDLDGDWPWPEPLLAYENVLLPHALIVAGGRLGEPKLTQVGLHVLDWLIRVQTARNGSFSPIGNAGWWPRRGIRSRFDQQPIEATATILAASAAFEATQDDRYRVAAEAAYGWFLGDNDVGIPVADVATGGCHDGLSARGVSRNEGAESTLMWLMALETIRRMRAGRAAAAAVGARPATRTAASRTAATRTTATRTTATRTPTSSAAASVAATAVEEPRA